MNKQLLHTYRQLNPTEQLNIRKSLNGQTLPLRLLDFLEACTNESFFNRDVVLFLYPEQTQPYSVLENRYYKIRKKLLDYLNMQSFDQASQSLFHRYEIELKTMQRRIREGQVTKTYAKLENLVNRLWNLNLFELLPEAIDSLIFANQTFNRLDKNQDLHQQYNLSLNLHTDLLQCLNRARKVYEVNFSMGMKAAIVHLNELKRFALKHPSYPRFKYCYEFASAYYKLGSREYVHAMNIVGRHMNSVWNLHNLHPEMPLFNFRVNYEYSQRYHLLEIRAFYLYNTCHFKSSYETYKQLLQEPGNSKSQLGLVNETTYINAIRGALAAEQPKDALDYGRKLSQFQAANNKHNAFNPVWMVYLQVYLDYGIQVQEKSPDDLYQQLLTDIVLLEQQGNRVFLGEALLLELKWCIIHQSWQRAEILISHTILQEALFHDTSLKQLLKEGIAYFSQKSDERQTQLFERQINRQRLKELHPQKVFLLRWLKRYFAHTQKKPE